MLLTDLKFAWRKKDNGILVDLNNYESYVDGLVKILEEDSKVFTSNERKTLMSYLKTKVEIPKEDREELLRAIEDEWKYPDDKYLIKLPLFRAFGVDSENNFRVAVYKDAKNTSMYVYSSNFDGNLSVKQNLLPKNMI